MQSKPLKELLQELEQELLRLGYTEGSMTFYRRRWEQILHFVGGKNEIYYSNSALTLLKATSKFSKKISTKHFLRKILKLNVFTFYFA